MRKFSFLSVLVTLIFVNLCKSQTVGDYRSVADGSWTTLATWERFTAGTWVTPNATQGYPGQNATPNQVTIREADDVTLNVTPANNLNNLTLDGDTDDGNGADLTVSGNSSLTLNGNFTLGNLLASVAYGGSGNLAVSGSLSIGAASFLTFSSTGNLSVTGTSTITGVFTDDENTGISTFVGAVSIIGFWVSTAVTTSSNLVFRGGITFNPFLGLTTFTAGGATFNTNNQTLSGTGPMDFQNGVVVTTITVTNNSEVTMSNAAAGTLSGTGTWTQGTGTLNYAGASIGVTTFTASATGNTVNYNGSVAQTVRNPTGSTYYNLTFNNSFGTLPQLTSTANTTVTNQLTMTSGIINLAGNTFTLGSSGVASTLSRTASTTTNWFYGGTFRRFWLNATAVSSTAGNLYGLFPMGSSSSSSYRPVAINSTGNPTATGSISLTHTNQTTSTDLSPVYDDDPTAGVTNIVRKNDAQFVIANSGVTGGTYNISVTMTGLAAGTLSDIRLAVSNGATTVTNVGTHVAATGTAQNPTATRNGVTPVGSLVGDFRITTINSTNTPLPIVLRYFKAKVDGNEVMTEWATAQEINNHFFTLQKTTDFEKYYDIVVVEGKGNSNEHHSYSFVDKSPFLGKSYYRLKQTDFDGKVTYSDPVMVRYDGPESIQLMAYPNPSNGSQITVELKGIKDTPSVPVHIYNQQGQKISDMILTEDGPGVIHEEIIFSTPLPQGLYILKAGKTLQLTRKIVVN